MSNNIRLESKELKCLKVLDARMVLSDKDKRHLINLQKGFEGEVLFDTMLESLECDFILLKDLFLQVGKSSIQIDTLLIHSNKVYLIEVKNFEGDFYYESGRIYLKHSKTEINNPMIQLERTESLFRQLLQSLGINMKVVAFVVFVNPEFTFYQCPQDLPVILPTQIKRFLQTLSSSSIKLSKKHTMLAETLESLHIKESPFTQLPLYEYSKLEKGIICKQCNTLNVELAGHSVACRKCGTREALETALLRSIDEYKLLFPERKLTTRAILDWCKIVENSKRIKRVLDKHYTAMGTRRWTYFE